MNKDNYLYTVYRDVDFTDVRFIGKHDDLRLFCEELKNSYKETDYETKKEYTYFKSKNYLITTRSIISKFLTYHGYFVVVTKIKNK